MRLAEELKQEKYSLICDIVKSKAPREIYLDSADAKKQEIQLRTKSDIVGALTAKNMLKVYARPTVLKNINKKYMKEVLKTLVEEERGDD